MQSSSLMLLLFFLLSSCAIAYSQASLADSLPARKMSFDKNISIGKLYMVRQDGGNFFLGEARGDVVCPEGKLLLTGSYQLVIHPELLDNVPPDALYELHFVDIDEDFKPLAPHIARLKGLQRLTFKFCPLDDKTVAQFAPLKKVWFLELHGTGVTGSCFKDLKSMTALSAINVCENKIDNQYVHYMVELPAVTDLDFDRSGLTDAGLAAVAKVGRFKYLDIGRNSITGKGLAVLKNCRTLHALNLTGCKLSAADIIALKDLPLQSLELPQFSIQDQAKLKAAFPKAKLIFEEAPKVNADIKHLFAPLK